jgi:hypothetical protein
MNASSPPSTAKPGGGSARSATVSASIPPTAYLPGPVRDVIDDERYGAGGDEVGEVGEHSRLAWAHERWHQAQRCYHLWPAPQRIQSFRSTCADQQLRRAFPANPSGDVDHGTLLRAAERGRLRGGAERDHAGRSGVEYLVCEGF